MAVLSFVPNNVGLEDDVENVLASRTRSSFYKLYLLRTLVLIVRSLTFNSTKFHCPYKTTLLSK
jgi:hypothetical protein